MFPSIARNDTANGWKPLFLLPSQDMMSPFLTGKNSTTKQSEATSQRGRTLSTGSHCVSLCCREEFHEWLAGCHCISFHHAEEFYLWLEATVSPFLKGKIITDGHCVSFCRRKNRKKKREEKTWKERNELRSNKEKEEILLLFRCCYPIAIVAFDWKAFPFWDC